MICIIAGNSQEAWVYARSHLLEREEWFYPSKIQDLYDKENFHVLVANYDGHKRADFELMFKIAKERGRVNRK